MQIDIVHIRTGNVISGIEKLEEDELQDFMDLLTRMVRGHVGYMKMTGLQGEDVIVGRNILIDSYIRVNKVS